MDKTLINKWVKWSTTTAATHGRNGSYAVEQRQLRTGATAATHGSNGSYAREQRQLRTGATAATVDTNLHGHNPISTQGFPASSQVPASVP